MQSCGITVVLQLQKCYGKKNPNVLADELMWSELTLH